MPDRRLVVATLMVWLVVCFLAGYCSKAHATAYLTSTQLDTLTVARHIGNQIEYKGETFPLTAQLLVWKESSAGARGANEQGVIIGDRHLPFGQKAYGKWQVRKPAYDEVFKVYPHLRKYQTEEEVVLALCTDDEYCGTIALHYFLIQYDRFGGNWRKAVTAYNWGPGAVQRGQYNLKYFNRLQEIREHIVEPVNRGDYVEISQ